MWKMEFTIMRTETNRDQLSRKANPAQPARSRELCPVAASHALQVAMLATC